MGENSNIEWCHHTFNPWMGCTKVSEACRHCYAERDMDQRYGKVAWGPSGTRVMTSPANWKKPLKWNRAAERLPDRIVKPGSLPVTYLPVERPRVFCASLADVFEDWSGPIHHHGGMGEIICRPYLESENTPEFWVPGYPETLATDPQGWSAITLDDVRHQLFRLIGQTPHLDWLLLTKRAERIRECWPVLRAMKPIFSGAPGKLGEPAPCYITAACRPNAWLGTSVEDRSQLHRIDELRRCRDLAPVLFLSCEPLLEDLGEVDLSGIDWVIFGTESGPHRRPMHASAAESLIRECDRQGVAVFGKQIDLNGSVVKDISQFPEVLRRREFPEVAHV